MAIDQERVKNHIIQTAVDGETLRVSAVPHVVTESEESRRKNRDVLADRATIAGAAERGFFGRMWYGLTETYQRLRRRDALTRFHDAGEDINLGSDAFERAKDRVREMVVQERDEVTATAISRNINNDIGNGDRTMVLDEESAGSERQEEIVTWTRMIVSEYASGEMDRDMMHELSENLSCELRDELPELFSNTTIGSDLAYIAEAARDAYIANQERIREIDLDLQICFGQVEAGMVTEERRDLADRVVDWAQSGRVKATLVNPLTVGAAASAVAVGAKAPFKSIPVIGGIAGGAFAAVRRWSKENKDRDLRVREEEIGYEIPQPSQHAGVERVLSGLVGQTDFREVSYQPRSALEVTEEFGQLTNADLVEKQTQAWRDNALNLLAETRVRLAVSEELGVGLVRYGQMRDENGQIEVTGISTINQDRLALILAARETQRNLIDQIGQADFDQRFEAAQDHISDQIADQYDESNSRFMRSKLLMSLRSGTFGFGVGVVGGIGIHELGEGIEQVSRKVADVFHQAHEQSTVVTHKDLPLGQGNVVNADSTYIGHQGLQVDVSPDVSAHFDEAKHVLAIDTHANGADPAKHFEVAYQPGMTPDQVHESLVKAGLDGKIEILKSHLDVPTNSSTEDILKPEYLSSHHLVDVTSQPHGIDFGHAQFLGDRHEYNELTLYQHDATHWSLGPHGLDGSAVKPFVYKDEPSWADPSIAANAPVNPDSLVAFYQISDAHGQLHTILAPQNGGHFTLPQEFVDPVSGKVDGVSIMGYGMVKDAHGNLIAGDQVLSHPELMNGATLHSMASVALEQKGHAIIGAHVDFSTIRLSDLNAHEDIPTTVVSKVSNEFIFDIPPIATPFAPRLFPDVVEPEKVDNSRFGPGYIFGYEGMFRQNREFYRNRLSQTLVANPEAKLDIQSEVASYLDSQDPEYRVMLESYLSQEGMQEPMEENSQLVVCVPVYDLGEGKVVRNALEQYLMQVDKTRNKAAVDPEKVELILFLNHPKTEREKIEDKLSHSYVDGSSERVEAGDVEAWDTEEIIKKFGAEHPELRIRVMKEEFERRQKWGSIIKPLYDAAVTRAVRRTNPGDVLILTNDIDVVNLSPAYFKTLLESKERAGGSRDGFVGKIDMPNHGYEKYPGFLMAERLYQFLDAQHRRKSGHVITQGRNTALFASAVAAVGGPNIHTDAGADTELGEMVKQARGNKDGRIEYLNSAWLETDPRREVDEWLKGVPLAYAWDSWGTMEKYGWDWKSKFFESAPGRSGVNTEIFEREVYFELERWGLSPDSEEIKRALEWLGFKAGDYHVGTKTIKHPRGGEQDVVTIVIDNFEHATDRLTSFRNEKRWQKTERKMKWQILGKRKSTGAEEPSATGIENENGTVSEETGESVRGHRELLPISVRNIVRRKHGKPESEARTLGLSKEEFEEAARNAATKGSADLEKRSLYAWIFMFEQAKKFGIDSDDLEEFEGIDLFKLLPKDSIKRVRFYSQKLTKHAALQALSEMSRAGESRGKVATAREKVVKFVPIKKRRGRLARYS